jgi:hypothetical protein
MNVSEFLFDLYQQGITVQVDHANLKVSAPEGELSPFIAEQLRENKAEIITYLLAACRITKKDMIDFEYEKNN